MALCLDDMLATGSRKWQPLSWHEPSPEVLTLKPIGPKLGILALHESQSNFRRSGILIAEGTQLENVWIGIVLNHGTKCKPCGLEFGDVVLLNRWVNSNWLFRTTPIGHESRQYVMRSEDGKRQFACTGKDHWCFVEPDKIPFVCGRWAHLISGMAFSRLTAGPDRMLVELDNDESSIINPEWSRAGKMTGKVISPSFDGQKVIINPMRGIRYQEPPDYDKWMVSIHADYVEAIGATQDFEQIREVKAVYE